MRLNLDDTLKVANRLYRKSKEHAMDPVSAMFNYRFVMSELVDGKAEMLDWSAAGVGYPDGLPAVFGSFTRNRGNINAFFEGR